MCDHDPESRSINFGEWRRARRHVRPEPHQQKKKYWNRPLCIAKKAHYFARLIFGWNEKLFLYIICTRCRLTFHQIIPDWPNPTCFSNAALRCPQLLSMSLPPSPCRHMLACLVLIIPLRAPDGSTHAENITGKTFACDLNHSLLLHHANKPVQRHH